MRSLLYCATIAVMGCSAPPPHHYEHLFNSAESITLSKDVFTRSSRCSVEVDNTLVGVVVQQITGKYSLISRLGYNIAREQKTTFVKGSDGKLLYTSIFSAKYIATPSPGIFKTTWTIEKQAESKNLSLGQVVIDICKREHQEE